MNRLKEKIQVLLADIRYICDEYIQDISDDCVLLQELINQNKPLTLEEVIKEWEEKGYEYYKGKNHVHFRYFNEHGSYDGYIFHPTELYYVANNTKVTFEMFQLISKTLKALEVKDE